LRKNDQKTGYLFSKALSKISNDFLSEELFFKALIHVKMTGVEKQHCC